MVTDEFFGDADIGVADLSVCDLNGFLPFVSLLQVLAA